jgi:hypothetical protein
MNEKEAKTRKYYEMIAQNVHKGDPYSIKFKNDPIRYVGIPVLDLTAKEEDAFSFHITEPEKNKGMAKKSIGDIESMEQL